MLPKFPHFAAKHPARDTENMPDPRPAIQQGIANHPMLPAIAKAIIAGQSSRSIADWVIPPLHFATIARYARNTVTPTLVKVSRLEAVLASNSVQKHGLPTVAEQIELVQQETQNAILQAPIVSEFRKQVANLRDRTDRALDRAESCDKHLPLMAGLLGQGHKNAELLGRATGELQEQQAPAVAIQIVMPSASPAPSTPAHGLIETIDISTVRR